MPASRLKTAMASALNLVRDLGRRDAALQVILQKLRSSSPLWLQRLARAQENFAAGTQLENFAPAAVRFSSVTTAAPVPDQPVTPVCPMLARDKLHQIELDLHRVLLSRQAEPLRETDHVRVYNDAHVFVKCVTQNNIRS